MTQIKWFDRKFTFESNQNIFPSILERLSGTPLRLEEKIKLIEPNFQVIKVDNTWSIKENLGHLSDLETLWQGRFEDIKNGNVELRPTDLQNNKTDLANHNLTPTNELLTNFRKLRQETILLIQDIEDALIFKTALHPRLKTPMRVMDLFLFVAEHDDHHLARITEITKRLTKY